MSSPPNPIPPKRPPSPSSDAEGTPSKKLKAQKEVERVANDTLQQGSSSSSSNVAAGSGQPSSSSSHPPAVPHPQQQSLTQPTHPAPTPTPAASLSVSSSSSASQSHFSETDLLSMIASGIEESRKKRHEKLGSLDPAVRAQLEQLEKALHQLDDLSIRNYQKTLVLRKLEGEESDLIAECSSDEESGEGFRVRPSLEPKYAELKEQIRKLEEETSGIPKEMGACVKSLLAQSGILGIDEGSFSDWYKLDMLKGMHEHLVLLCVSYFREQLFNKIINKINYIQYVSKVIESKKGEILKIFCSDGNNINPSDVSCLVECLSSETHNGGKVACIVKFIKENKCLLKVVYKPRDAKIDISVIDVFKKLNSLPSNQRSGTSILPVYKIITLLEQGSEFGSVWQFIEGVHAEGDGDIAIQLLQGNTAVLMQKLARLESVCRYLYISDLHEKNVIFSGLEGNDPEVVPIDLESLQGGATGLSKSSSPSINLTQYEKAILDTFRDSIAQIPFRQVLVETGILMSSCSNPMSVVETTRELLDVIQARGFTPRDDLGKLLPGLLLGDFFNDDIPYFTELGNMLYFGEIKNGIRIGWRRSDQNE